MGLTSGAAVCMQAIRHSGENSQPHIHETLKFVMSVNWPLRPRTRAKGFALQEALAGRAFNEGLLCVLIWSVVPRHFPFSVFARTKVRSK